MNNMNTAIISGVFDPVTVGHEDIIRRASALFDRVVIAVSVNAEKKCLFPPEVRVEALNALASEYGNVTAIECDGLLAAFCQKYDNPVIVRGARNGSDFDYERELYIINQRLGVHESIVLPARSGLDHISSTYAREMIKYGKSLEGIIPEPALAVYKRWTGECK